MRMTLARKGVFVLCCRRLFAAVSCFALLGASVRPAGADEPLAVRLFDTGDSSLVPLPPDALANKDNWTLLPEDEARHNFAGDAVISNGKLAVVFRKKGRGAEVHAVTPGGLAMRAELVPLFLQDPLHLSPIHVTVGPGGMVKGPKLLPLAVSPTVALVAVEIVENNPGVVVVDAVFSTIEGKRLQFRCELKLGQVFVQTQPRSINTGLQVVAPCRFAVLPDFFADDIVVDAAETAVSEAELPSEHFLLHLLGEGEAIVMAVWHPAQDDVRVTLSGQGASRAITSSEIHYAPEGKAWVAVINGPGTWHRRDITGEEAGKIIDLDWKAPCLAHWRVDWRRADKLTDSWEMLTQSPDGQYVKHGWYGQPESFGNDDWLREERERWTTVLGFFMYPCWLDRQGAGHLQPLKKGVRFQGPALIYPINRLEATPLEQFTVVDIMRATLGIGPCEYILDVEGQKKTFQGRPTCASRTILDGIYASKQQKQQREVVEKTLDEVLAFVRHIRGRIEDYIVFGHEVGAYLEEQKRAQPQLAGLVTEMQETTGRIDNYVARRKNAIKTPEYASGLVAEFRRTLIDYEGADALAKCKRITAALVDIGGNQDELVGECRMVVKILRQQAALAMAGDPRAAQVGSEVRRRTQQMLRNPTSYEAPRH